MAAEHAAHHVDDLQCGIGFAAHHPLAAIIISKGVIGCRSPASEHQCKAAFIVGGAGLEGIARCLQQVDIGARLMVDEVEVVHHHFLRCHAEGIAAVCGGAEADGQLTLGLGVDDGVVGAILCHIELREVGVEHQLT